MIWCLTIFFLLGVGLCIFMTPRYESVGEIEVQESATDSLGLGNLSSGERLKTLDALNDNITLQTEAQVLESESIALKVINDLRLESTDDFKPHFNPIAWVIEYLSPKEQEDSPNASLEDAPYRRDRAVKIFEKHLKIKPVAGTRLIEIHYKSSEPKVAAAVVDTLAKSLVDFTLENRNKATSQVSKWLESQLSEVKRDAQNRQENVERLERESGVYSSGISDIQGKEIAFNATLERLRQATDALSMATSTRILKGGLYQTVQNGDPEMIANLAGSTLAGSSPSMSSAFTVLQGLRSQQATLASQVAADESKYGDANPKLSDEKASLGSIDTAIKAEVARIGQRVANDFKAAEVVEDNLRGVYEKERKAAEDLNDKAVALLVAQQEAADAQMLYRTLYSHLKEAGVIEGLHSSNISIIDPGRVAAKPVTPNMPVYIGIATLLGGVLGAIGAFLAEIVNDRVEEMTVIEHSLKTRILGVLPTIPHSNLSRSQTPGIFGGIRKLVSGNRPEEEGRLAVMDGPNTAYVEALRGLRASLLHPRKGPLPKTILVTSGAEREGKSTLSLNLAAVFALNGSRVLLVDADLRGAGLSAYMGDKRHANGLVERTTPGLSEVLKNLADVNMKTPFEALPNLSAISAGAAPSYPAELLGSPRMQTLMHKWSAEYDYVVIDTPPLLAVTDALILARMADYTLLVSRYAQSTQKSLQRSYQTLHDVEGIDVGIVVNGVSRNAVSYSEFYGYNGTVYYKGA